MKQHLIICSRYPRQGHCKTRLIPHLGAEQAAELQKKMTEKLVLVADHLRRNSAVSVSLFYSDGDESLMNAWLGPRTYVAQQGNDLGQRMEHAFGYVFSKGYQEVILVGSDIPSLDTPILQHAFAALKSHDAVLGPTVDGGYYLIGFRSEVFNNLAPELFTNMPWSTEMVCSITAERIAKEGYSHTQLTPLQDIDTYDDLLEAQKMGYI